MTLLDEIKGEKADVPFDKYIIFLLALGFSKADIVRLTGVSRTTIHNCVGRHRELLEKYDLA